MILFYLPFSIRELFFYISRKGDKMLFLGLVGIFVGALVIALMTMAGASLIKQDGVADVPISTPFTIAAFFAAGVVLFITGLSMVL